MARLAANVLQHQLDDRVEEVDNRANDPQLIAALREVASPHANHAKLQMLLQRYKKYDRLKFFYKWTLVDPHGFILADEIHEPSLYGRSWAWRDWFNGTGHKFGQEGQEFPPVEHPYISGPYVAQGIDDEKHANPLSLSITVPVTSERGQPTGEGPQHKGKLLGLLVATMHFQELYQVFEHIGLEVLHGDVIVLNERKQCLMHKDMEQVKRSVSADRNFEPLPDSPVIQAVIDRREEGSDRHFLDPLTGKECLAGYAPVKHYHWGVIVVHERDVALHPVANLRGWLASWGTMLFVIMSLVTTGLWGALIWTLRREECAAWTTGKEAGGQCAA